MTIQSVQVKGILLMPCLIFSILNIRFTKMRYHLIANEMAQQFHYVISHPESRLSISTQQYLE